MTKPLLSIGIIFKNEVRCLERCLKSLQPLRDTTPCELVMADTGSDDGSRGIAEKYADILFDFPWINDFAAARNAVMDRCSGKWYLSIDADEWLDADVSELVAAVKKTKRSEIGMALVIRNYLSPDLRLSYSDFVAMRLLYMNSGIRYVGSIHEHWEASGNIECAYLGKTVLHHDGYVVYSQEQERAKLDRNLTLLREELKKDPDNLIALLQYIESGAKETDYLEKIRHAKKLTEAKHTHWEKIGPPILRHAVTAAHEMGLPETDAWIKDAESLFPDSPFTCIDVQYYAFCRSFTKKDYSESISRGKRYFRGLANQNSIAALNAQMYSTLKVSAPFFAQHIKILMGVSYCELGQYENVLPLLNGLDFTLLNVDQAGNMAKLIGTLQRESNVDTQQLIISVWNAVVETASAEKTDDSCKNAFASQLATFFTPDYRRKEVEKERFFRHAYTACLPLEGKNELGCAAAILENKNSKILTEKLYAVKHWKEFPIHALAHALTCGATFPLPQKTLTLEEIDRLAGRLSGERSVIISLAIQTSQQDFANHWDGLVWARGLALAAVRSCDWKEMKSIVSTGTETKELPVSGTSPEQKLKLARAFAVIEGEFVPRCYAQEILREEAIFALPSMHRFGWYCAQAFEALDTGDAAGYVRYLRKGLTMCESAREMVEFLINATPDLKDPSEDLNAMAEQIRAVLAKFSPGDPAVVALKQNEAYQKVAYLIEGTASPVVGRLLQ